LVNVFIFNYFFIESVGDTVIKLDEFEKLRRAFTSSA